MSSSQRTLFNDECDAQTHACIRGVTPLWSDSLQSGTKRGSQIFASRTSLCNKLSPIWGPKGTATDMVCLAVDTEKTRALREAVSKTVATNTTRPQIDVLPVVGDEHHNC
mmetsp:Transcript_107650/g.246470  ORF Transcript_107650/g.246470 Transcript_107650/m.246470 type:complete len:110 (-) Transcript_107650:1077-1406(-)